MGCLITRPGLARHSYQPGSPGWVVGHAFTAELPGRHGGQVLLPLSAGMTSFAADGAPFYNSGYPAGYKSIAVGMNLDATGLRLPPKAAQVDLTDMASWDRPVMWPPGTG